MNPHVVYLNARVKMAREFAQRYPGRVGVLLSSNDARRRNPCGLAYVIDNGKYAAWANDREWESDSFDATVVKVQSRTHKPRWLAVPDEIADARGTFRLWAEWYPRLSDLGCPLALVVQDGMTTESVRRLRPKPDVIFVGGTTSWKWRTLWDWCGEFPRVHVGRVNTTAKLWAAHRCGAESSDGTGWWHDKQKGELVDYLDRTSSGRGQFDHEYPTLELFDYDRRKPCS